MFSIFHHAANALNHLCIGGHIDTASALHGALNDLLYKLLCIGFVVRACVHVQQLFAGQLHVQFIQCNFQLVLIQQIILRLPAKCVFDQPGHFHGIVFNKLPDQCMSTAASGHAARHTADCGNQSACTTGSNPQNGLSCHDGNCATYKTSCKTSSNSCDVFDQLLNGDPSAKGIADV